MILMIFYVILRLYFIHNYKIFCENSLRSLRLCGEIKSYSNFSKVFKNLAHLPKVFELKCCLSWSLKNEMTFIEFPIVSMKSSIDITRNNQFLLF